MAKSDEIMRDIEAQSEHYNPENRGFNQSDLERIRSAGVVTISPELFEKVNSIAFNCFDFISCILDLRARQPEIFATDLRIQHHLDSWGRQIPSDLN
jgi:hypothetical protein